MPTYVYGLRPNNDGRIPGEQIILCLSAEKLLACLVYAQAPDDFTLDDVRALLGDAHFEDHFDDEHPYDGTMTFTAFGREDEWYQYPDKVMLGDLPREFQALGTEDASMTGSWLDLPASQELALQAAAKQLNLPLIRDDALIEAVDPWVAQDRRLSQADFDAFVAQLRALITGPAA